MKKLTNYAPGPRGVTTKDGGVVWIKPNETVEIDEKDIVKLPDLGSKPKAEADSDADDITALQTENAALKEQVKTLTADLEKATKPPVK